MAIVWGSANGGLRLGVEFTRTSSNASSETWRCDAYIQTTTAVWDETNTYTVSGAFAGTGTANIPYSETRTKFFSQSKTFTKQYGKAVSQSVSVSITGINAGNVPAMSASFTVAARAYSAPAQPSNVSARYVATNRATVSWGRVASTAAPVSGFTVAYRTAGASSWSYVNVASSTSWTSPALRAGQEYEFAVRQTGAGGNSAFAYSSSVGMTPVAPANAVASRSGSNIALRWTRQSTISGTSFDIYEGSTLVASGVTGTSYTVSSPDPAVAHTYRVRERSGSLVSPFATFNTVQLLQAPLAPSDLQPNGEAQVTGSSVTLSWVHNPVDGTSQAVFELRHRQDGGAWTVVTGTTASSVNITAGGSLTEFEVRTKGDHADWSPWSNTASFEVASRPTLSLTVPASITSDSVPVTITPTTVGDYGWQAEAIIDGKVHQASSGYGRSPFRWDVRDLPNGAQVTFRARIQSAVWSNWTSVVRTVAYSAPGKPSLSAEWISDSGAVELAVTNASGAVATVSNMLQSRVNEGEWHTVDLEMPLNASWVDYTPSLAGTVEYRVGAVAETGVVAWSDPVAPSGSFACAHYLNFGDGFAQVVVLRYNPEQTISVGLQDIELVTFAGQTVPTALLGEATNLSRSLAGTLITKDDSRSARELAELVRELAQWPGLVMARTIDHEPVTGVVSDVKLDQLIWGGYQVSLIHTRAK